MALRAVEVIMVSVGGSVCVSVGSFVRFAFVCFALLLFCEIFLLVLSFTCEVVNENQDEKSKHFLCG